MNTKYFIGILYILYALVKIIIGSCLFLLPLNTISKTPVLNIFTKEAADTTLAGRMYEYVLFAFGIFSLFEGLALLDQLPPALTIYFESKWTEYTVFIILGTILTVFYSLVLYTRLPISKNTIDTDHYKLLGFFAGISFLCMPLLWEFIAYTVPAFRNLSFEARSIFVIGFAIIVAICADLIHTYLKRKKESVSQVLPQGVQQNIAIAEAVKDVVTGTHSPVAKAPIAK
jgi:hypothetical protein